MSKNRQPQPRQPMKIGAIAEYMATATAEGVIPRRPFKAPDLPPGVVPRGEKMACDNVAATGNYGWLNAQQGWCGLGFPGYTYLSELAQRSEYRAPAEVTATELTRKWIRFTGADEDKLKELTQAFEDFGVREHFATMGEYDGLFGRGNLYVNIKGQDAPQSRRLPLVVDAENKGKTIAKGSLVGFKPIEPIWTTPSMYNSNDPTKPDFYKPDMWYVLGVPTHASRLLTFVSRPVPDILKPAYNFSGMSLSQLIEPYVVRWLKTVDSVNRLISNYSTSGIRTNLMATLEGGNGGDIFKRMQLFNQMRDNRGVLVLDKDSEEFFQFNAPLAGLGDLQAQAQEHMAAPTHIPLVKLTGITPSGLNASSEEDLIVWYDWIAALQNNFLSGHLRTVLKIVQCHLWGAPDADIKFEWIALNSPTTKEESEIRKADGDRDTAYVGGGIVSPDEVRERLRNDPNSGYTFIEGDAPLPPLEQEAGIMEEGKQADHERGEESAAEAHARNEESAAAQHKRDVALERAKPKPKG